MIAGSILEGVLATLPLIEIRGSLWRVVKNEYVQGPPPGAPPGSGPQPLWPGGAPRKGARFTPVGGMDSLYLASNGATALAEVDAVLFDTAAALVPGAKHDPLLVIANRVRLPALLDLCDPKVQAALGTSEAELTRPWLRAQARHAAGKGPLPPTQELGQAAFATKQVLGLRYPSRKHRGQKNVVVFTDRLASLRGWVKSVDKSGHLIQTLP